MKNSFFYLIILVLSTITFIESCTYDKGELPKPIINASYQATIKPIIQTNCYGQGAQTCHVTPSNEGAVGDFSTYAGLKAKVDNGTIQSRVFNTAGGMPPAYSTGPSALTTDDMEKLKAWVNNGALDN